MASILTGEKKLVLHQIVLFVILVTLTLWRLVSGSWTLNTDVVLWWLGAVIGFSFVFTDRLIYAFWQHPEETLSLTLRQVLGGGRWMSGLSTLLTERETQKHLMMRSVLFLGVWLALGFLTMANVSNALGRGFMLGLGIHLTFDLLTDTLLRRRDLKLWFWQIKRDIPESEMKMVVWGYTILFLLVAWGL